MHSRLKIFLSVIAVALSGQLSVCADQQLLRMNQPSVKTSFVDCTDDGSFQFQFADKKNILTRQNLVRWSTPRLNLSRHEVVLTDGSRLVLAETWASKEPLQIFDQTVTIVTSEFGKVKFPRNHLRVALLSTAAEATRRTQLLDRLLAWQGKGDQLHLTNGDALTGKLQSLGGRTPGLLFTLAGTTKPVTIAANRVAGFVLGPPSQKTPAGKLAVGFSEGSYLVTKSLIKKNDSLQLQLACGIQLIADDSRDIVHLQSLGTPPIYLSDLDPIEYRHKPFLDIPWPYKRDRNLQGGPLRVKESIYPKGLAMHSASWLTYDLPSADTNVRQFAAQLAIEDTVGNHGSVLFKVYLSQAGKQQLAYTSPIIRGGDSPQPISVKLANADRLILVVEYADQGDQNDHAIWLDARLE